MAEQSREGVILDRSGDTWVGSFPGLGRIEVASDGCLKVEAEAADGESPDAGESVEIRQRALRYGWGEPLSLVRRGFSLAHGAAVCPPSDGPVCLLLHGDPHDCAIVLITLASHGWKVLGDRPQPVLRQPSGLVAWPREAPLVVGFRRLQRAGLKGDLIRDHTSSHAVALPRCTSAHRVAAICSLRGRRPTENVLTPLSGHEHFELAASLFLRGVLAEDSDGTPEQTLARDLQVASIPAVRLTLGEDDTMSQDVEDLLAWWAGVVTP